MKLPRLQLHLSTLLIVTLLAAGLVWLNVRQHEYRFQISENGEVRPGFLIHMDYPVPAKDRGWPLTFETSREAVFERNRYYWNWNMFALDVTISLPC